MSDVQIRATPQQDVQSAASLMRIDSHGNITSKPSDVSSCQITDSHLLAEFSSLEYLRSGAAHSVDLSNYSIDIEPPPADNRFKKGKVAIGNATYVDKICESDFQELLNVILNSRYLLSTKELSGNLKRHKHILLCLLVSLNWGVYDTPTQMRLNRAMEQRIKVTHVCNSTKDYEFFNKV